MECQDANYAREKGFIVGAKVKLPHDREVGEVVELTEGPGIFVEAVHFKDSYIDPPYCVHVKFARGTFAYRVRELRLVRR